MAFIPIPNGIKIEIIGRKGGAPNVNIVWGTTETTISGAFLETLADAVVAWWNANIKPLVTASFSLESVVCTQWDIPNGLQHVEDLVTPSVGTATGADTPSNVAAVTTFYTGYTGRSNRGRVYNGGIADAAVVTNTLTTSYVASMLTAWSAFQGALANLSVVHVVASFQSNNAPRVIGVPTPITEYGMNNVVDTQRRRIPKVDN